MKWKRSSPRRWTAPRTMILLDPDLDRSYAGYTPDSAGPARRSAVRGSARGSRSLRLPSARTLARFLREAQAVVGLPGEVSVLLTTDPAVRRLNRRFRGKDKPTDVLSFPASALPDGPEKIVGDLAISVPTARRQAVEQGHALSIEIKVLILHGLLHLAGYDHESDEGEMARRERRLRGRLGLLQGLIERSADDPGGISTRLRRGGRKNTNVRSPARSKRP